MSPHRKARLTAPLLLFGLLLLAAAFAAWGLRQQNGDIAEILSSDVGSMRAAEELEVRLHETRNRLDRFLLTGNRRSLEELSRLRGESDRWLAEADRLGTTEREQQLMARAKSGCREFYSLVDAAVLARPRHWAARATRERIDRELTEEVLVPVHDYLDYNEQLAARGAEHNRSTASWTVFGLLLLGGSGPALGLVRSLPRGAPVRPTGARTGRPKHGSRPRRTGRRRGRATPRPRGTGVTAGRYRIVGRGKFDASHRTELDPAAVGLLRYLSGRNIAVVGDNAPRIAAALGVGTSEMGRAADLLAALGLIEESPLDDGMRRWSVTDDGLAYLRARDGSSPRPPWWNFW